MTDHPEHHHEHTLSYEDAVQQFRDEKDEYFASAADSPIPEEQRAAFTGLAYFSVDEGLVVEGLELEPYTGTEPARFSIPTSDGRLRPAERAGVLRFDLGGQELALTGYRFAGDEDDGLFVPFLDTTSGAETYGAGRYLDLEPEDDGTWTIDFNLAYQPLCVHDPRYSCPLTPAENRLPIRIEAGERLPVAS
jgi:uncharacterized protein (DUF1684 family)